MPGVILPSGGPQAEQHGAFDAGPEAGGSTVERRRKWRAAMYLRREWLLIRQRRGKREGLYPKVPDSGRLGGNSGQG